ncbi:MAG: hypothetical protein COA78_29440 [Blastopirellula sp.]|nr:MAG: hypothetical protein COA78_29440 [Blastopirellula sp.]
MSVIESNTITQPELTIDAVYIKEQLQTNGPSAVGYIKLKDLLDRILAAIMLVPAFPMIVALIVVVRLTSRGPGIFKQARVGKDGKNYTMYKLRSMTVDAETKTGPAWSQGASDPRTTFVGKILRKLYLDELPQLFNVVKGEMSLIGPRPERPEFVQILGTDIPGYLNRLAIKPGITGLAQINLPADSDLDSVKKKLVLDTEYIQTAGFFLDLRILLCTALKLIAIKGTTAISLMNLKREVTLIGDPTSEDATAKGVVSLKEALGAEKNGLKHEVNFNGTESSKELRRTTPGKIKPR